jgi:hypothetical protein
MHVICWECLTAVFKGINHKQIIKFLVNVSKIYI